MLLRHNIVNVPSSGGLAIAKRITTRNIILTQSYSVKDETPKRHA